MEKILFKDYYDVAASQNNSFNQSMKDLSKKVSLRFNLGFVKEYPKAENKYMYEKGENAEAVTDIIRGRLWAASLLDHYKAINFLNSNAQVIWEIHEIRDSHYPVFTNGFKPNFSSKEVFSPRLYRDLKVILKKVQNINNLPVYAELQMHLEGYENINEETHRFYDEEKKLIAGLYDPSYHFTHHDVSEFFSYRLRTILLNQQATEKCNQEARFKKEAIYLLSGRKIIEKEADKIGVSYDKQVLKMLTKGFLEKEDKNNRFSRFSVDAIEREYGKFLLKEIHLILR